MTKRRIFELQLYDANWGSASGGVDCTRSTSWVKCMYGCTLSRGSRVATYIKLAGTRGELWAVRLCSAGDVVRPDEAIGRFGVDGEHLVALHTNLDRNSPFDSITTMIMLRSPNGGLVHITHVNQVVNG